MAAGSPRLARYLSQYSSNPGSPYHEIYVDHGDYAAAFASIHERLDGELSFMNQKDRNGRGGHFNASNSRTLLGILDEIDRLRKELDRLGVRLEIAAEYSRVIDGCRLWLEGSGGSAIPEGFTPILIEEYDAVFHLADSGLVVPLNSRVDLQLVGEGAYAVVHKFVEPNYGMVLARKRLKSSASEREAERFRREFDIMKNLDFPYLLTVYTFNGADNSYVMEFCNATLESYVARHNGKPAFDLRIRKRIALQFLYGLNYIHNRNLCHRDISLKNILIREYEGLTAIVRLSDFGLAKDVQSDFTRTESEIRGTIIDPALDRFKDFAAVNDIYAVGHVLSYLFTGRKVLLTDGSALSMIIQRCSHSDPRQRYQRVIEVIRAVEEWSIEGQAGA